MTGNGRSLQQLFGVDVDRPSAPPPALQSRGSDHEMNVALILEVRDTVLELSQALHDLARVLRDAGQEERPSGAVKR